MTDKTTITLAGKDYGVTVPLTLGQIIDCRVACIMPMSGDDKQDLRNTYFRSLDIIIAGLCGDVHEDLPELTREALIAMRMSESEMNAAVEKILRVSGLKLSTEGDAPGEAQAEAE